MNIFKRLLSKIISKMNDPVLSCSVYKEVGCCHVDGYLCDMKTCPALKEYKKC